jgi:hypothetical protein
MVFLKTSPLYAIHNKNECRHCLIIGYEAWRLLHCRHRPSLSWLATFFVSMFESMERHYTFPTLHNIVLWRSPCWTHCMEQQHQRQDQSLQTQQVQPSTAAN